MRKKKYINMGSNYANKGFGANVFFINTPVT